MTELTPKQERFVDEYLVDLNATQAAIRAGYSKKTAEQQGYQLLQKTSVLAAIQEAKSKRSERTEITQDWVLQTLVETVERCRQAAPVLDKKGDPVFVETASGDVAPVYRFVPAAVLKGVELAGKHLGMFVDRKEVELSVYDRLSYEGKVALLEILDQMDLDQEEKADPTRH